MKTASDTTAVQIVPSSRLGSRDVEHIGEAHDEVELELLKVAAQQQQQRPCTLPAAASEVGGPSTAPSQGLIIVDPPNPWAKGNEHLLLHDERPLFNLRQELLRGDPAPD